MSEGWGGGSTTRWRKTRWYVLERDGYVCHIGDVGCTEKAEHVDHIIPKSMGGSDHPSNLRAACMHCNLGRKITRITQDPPIKRVSSW
jgi:5-methylcytosine-specific restriction endonuclease McrA